MIEKILVDSFMMRNPLANTLFVLLLCAIMLALMIENGLFLIVVLVALHGGIAGILTGQFITYRDRKQLLRDGRIAKGVVKEWGDQGSVFAKSAAVVEYAVGGRSYHIADVRYTRLAARKEKSDDVIAVLYNPMDPEEAYVKETFSYWHKPFNVMAICCATALLDSVILTMHFI